MHNKPPNFVHISLQVLSKRMFSEYIYYLQIESTWAMISVLKS